MGEPALADAEARLYLLRPRGSSHFGTHADDLTRVGAFPSADTLFGALAWAHRQRFGAAAFDAWLGRFVDGDPPFLMTSALPALDLEGPRLLFPLPVRRPPRLDDRKLLKRARYVDRPVLAWLGGGPAVGATAVSGGPAVGPTLLSAEGATGWAAVHTSAPGARRAAPVVRRPWVDADSVPRPRVTVDRVSGASALFATGGADYGRVALGVGLVVRDPDAIPAFEACLDVLGAAGIGGERSVGAGGFDWSRAPMPWPLTAAPRGPLLSVCSPTQAQLASGALDVADDRGYRLVERSGWVSSPEWHGYRSRAVGMLAEGSYLNPVLVPLVGGMADVTPEPGRDRHPVYRYGYGVFLDEARGAS